MMKTKKLKKLTKSEKKELTFLKDTYKWEENYNKIFNLRMDDTDFSYDKDNRCNCIGRERITDIEYECITDSIFNLLKDSDLESMCDKNMIKKAISNRCKLNVFSEKSELKQIKKLEEDRNKEKEKIAKKEAREKAKAEKAAQKINLPNVIYKYLKDNYPDLFEYNVTTKTIYYNGNQIKTSDYDKIIFDVCANIYESSNSTKLVKAIIEDIAKEKSFKETLSIGGASDDDFDLIKDIPENEWEKYLQTDEKENLKHTIFNYMLFLSFHPQFAEKIKMNSFDKIEYLVRYDRSFEEITNKPIDDYEADLMKSYIEKYFGSCIASTFNIALNNVLLRNSYHPLKEYFHSIKYKWDGIPRVRKMLVKYFDCPDIDPIHEMTEVMMCGAYQRIVEERPDSGCPFDYMGVIIGLQGTGKTKFFTRLFGDKYTVINPDVNNDQTFTDLTNRAWLVLFDEMKAIDKADLPTVKSRITEQGCNVRLSYGRRSKYFPRHSIFWGNTNEAYILRDEGYERRFLCFESKAVKKPSTWWKENYTDETIDQLWAETASIYYEKYAGKIIEISQDTELYNQTVQIRHKIWNDDTRTKLEIESIITQKYEKMIYFMSDFKQFLRETDIKSAEKCAKNDEKCAKNDEKSSGFELKIVKKEWILSRFNRKNAWIDGIIKQFGWSEIEIDDDFLGKGTYYIRKNCSYEELRKEYEESFEHNNLLANSTLTENEFIFFK